MTVKSRATARPLEIGDIVRLKSGSSVMSVVAFRRDGSVICVWFDGREHVQRAAFPAAALGVHRR